MIEGFKAVACIPAGRRRYMQCGLPYLFRALDRGILDGLQIWSNTLDKKDLAYIEKLGKHPKVRIITAGDPRRAAANVSKFYSHAGELDTIYAKLDDDQIWFAPDFFEQLFSCRVANPNPLLVSASVINCPIPDFLRDPKLTTTPVGKATDHTLCEIGWRTPEYAEHLHHQFLDSENWQDWKTPDRVLDKFQRFSIGAICWFGRDFCGITVPAADEDWLTEMFCQWLGRPNMICGSAVCSHFAFHTQRDYLDTTDVLQRYAALSRYTALTPGHACSPARASDILTVAAATIRQQQGGSDVAQFIKVGGKYLSAACVQFIEDKGNGTVEVQFHTGAKEEVCGADAANLLNYLEANALRVPQPEPLGVSDGNGRFKPAVTK